VRRFSSSAVRTHDVPREGDQAAGKRPTFQRFFKRLRLRGRLSSGDRKNNGPFRKTSPRKKGKELQKKAVWVLGPHQTSRSNHHCVDTVRKQEEINCDDRRRPFIPDLQGPDTMGIWFLWRSASKLKKKKILEGEGPVSLFIHHGG